MEDDTMNMEQGTTMDTEQGFQNMEEAKQKKAARAGGKASSGKNLGREQRAKSSRRNTGRSR